MRRVPVKLALCYIFTACMMFIVVNIAGNRYLGEKLLKSIKEEYYKNATIIADEYMTTYYGANISMPHMLQQMKRMDELIDARIWFVNSRNEVVIDTRSNLSSGQLYLDKADEHLLEQRYTENVNYSGIFREPMLIITEPVTYDYAVRGHVCVCVPMSMVRQRTVYYMDIVNICILIITGILSAAFTVVYFTTAFQIKRIRKAAIEYASGNYDYPMKVKSHDEYRDLADTIHYMVGEIKSADDYQKKFIANISHDFRSPLTSIRGYAEAIKDGTIPVEAQNKYLDIILFESERLTKLTANLLELNGIDNHSMRLDVTSFDINSIIKKTTATFEGICVQKKIVLNLVFMSKNTYVDADMSKIQQVLYNLIDNAIKFSESNSQVNIETEEKGTKALIRVRDSGMGIPKDSIKKIWDRFYKSDTSRGRDKKGTGLGLSIVKEIMNAHDENINVISTEGVGTEFTFTLPLAGT